MYKVYKHIHTGEEVMEDDWTYYAKEKLGIKIEPQGKNGEFTLDQIEFLQTFTEWYFSGEWIEEKREEI